MREKKMNTREAAEYVGVSERYFLNGRSTQKVSLPAHYRIGRKIYYRVEDLDVWLKQFRVEQRATVA